MEGGEEGGMLSESDYDSAKEREDKKHETKEFKKNLELKDDLFDDEESEGGMSYEDDENDSDWGSEDDPERLWCICQKQHDNRFMICCDRCEDWFHGSCVGITKARGKVMEENEEEWICPVCKDKEKKEAKENKKSDRETSPDKKKRDAEDKKKSTKESDSESEKAKSSTSKSASRESSVSRDTSGEGKPKLLGEIRKKEKRPDQDDGKKKRKRFKVFKKSPAKDKDKPPRQHCISTGCEEWAREGSVYCKPGCIVKHAKESLQLLEKEKAKMAGFKSKAEKGKQADKVVVLERHSGRLVTGPTAPTTENLEKWLQRHPTFEVLRPGQQAGHMHSVNRFYSQKKERDKEREKREQERKDREKERNQKERQRERKESHKDSAQPKQEPTSTTSTTATVDPMPIRMNVRKALKDTLSKRAHDSDDMVMTNHEIKKLTLTIETELFRLYGDVSSKYKAKFRSLLFNIKDPKNEGFFRKILTNHIKPYKLVRMSPEEMASKELATWRERENKHILEMIELSEKEAASSGSHVVKKTHKGEEIIDEGEDLTILADEVKPEKHTPSWPASDLLGSLITDTTDKHKTHLFDLNCKICTGKIKPPSEETPPPAKKPKIAKMVRIEGVKEKEEKVEKEDLPYLPRSEVAMASTDVTTEVVEPPVPKPEEKAPVSVAKEEVKSPPADSSSSSIQSPDSALQAGLDKPASRQKENSVWKGFVFHPDLPKFFTVAYKVSGPTDFLNNDLPDTIHVVGRIVPEQIFDYLDKLRNSSSRDIIIIRLEPPNEEEKNSYVQFYSYLNSRSRCGVVANHNPHIKDMYLIPLASHSRVPSVLLPFDGP
ncbi:death-inducer obliterator 1-like, partial [Lingula anatina]|uniref:Death-inducer obliterator 1-like n=1 Tax=Lingula anatina TaxID=7574 RepID=A0A1S3IPM4_LINAN